MDDDSEQTLIGRIKSIIGKKSSLQKSSDLSEEIHDLINESQAKGLITDEESDMVTGVLDLKDTTVYSIMIPRTDISSASIDSTLGELIGLVTDCGHTRIPIYKENIDSIVGILNAKDLLRHFGKDPDSKIPSDMLREPFFVPGTLDISALLRDLKAKKTHLAIVTDEYGGTAGIITIEDILEEIVGEIMDEHDNERPLLSVIDERSVLVDARLDIEKLEGHFNLSLPKTDFESVGGFIIHILGRIPKVDEKILYEGLEMTIQSADYRKIEKILISHKLPSGPIEEKKH